MKADAFLANAQRMLASDECSSRAIIHAAYYAVYHFVATSAGQNPAVKGNVNHSSLDSFVNAYVGSDPALYAAKLNFSSLKVMRIKADYRLSDVVTKKDAALAVGRALRIFTAAGIVPQSD